MPIERCKDLLTTTARALYDTIYYTYTALGFTETAATNATLCWLCDLLDITDTELDEILGM